MKKIFTLFVSLSMMTLAFAQNHGNHVDNENRNDAVYNDRNKKDNDRFNDRNDFSKRQMDIKIADVDRDYDKQIREVKGNWYMSRSKKQRIIFKPEDQRRDEIRMVYANFNDNRNRNAYSSHRGRW
ncbi:hypothetical protein BH11BAC4_BH11BAC4_19390 [soil metagenome]